MQKQNTPPTSRGSISYITVKPNSDFRKYDKS